MSSIISTATSTEVNDADLEIAVLPVGAFEQHGSHLPLSTDTLIASIIAKRIADEYSLFLLPPITISCSHEHADFSGTISIQASTLTLTIDDIRTSLSQQGIDRLILVNAHGGNYVLQNLVQQANVGGPCVCLFPGRRDWASARKDAGMKTNSSEDMHGGELETSILLHAMPEVVHDHYRAEDHEQTERPDLLSLGMAKYTKTGIIGRPSLANVDKGGKVLTSLAASAVHCLRLLSG